MRTIQIVRTGEQARAARADCPVDLVVLDWSLPDADGRHLLKCSDNLRAPVTVFGERYYTVKEWFVACRRGITPEVAAHALAT